MTDIYVKPVIIDIETGDIIDNDSFDTKLFIDDLRVKMNDGKGHIIESRTVNPN